MTSSTPLHIALVTDSERTAHDVRCTLASFDRMSVVPLGSGTIVTERSAPGGAGRIERGGALTSVTARSYDAVLVEWDTLNAGDVGALCQRLRAPGVFMLAVGGDGLSDHVTALALGADCYQTLPLSAPLLRAQIAAHRRHAEQPRPEPDRPVWALQGRVCVGLLSLDWGPRTATVGTHEMDLTARQFEVLALFAACPGDVVTRERVLRDVWGADPGTNVVDVVVHHLRRSFERLGVGDAFRTVRGCGYRFVLPAVPSPGGVAALA